VTLLGFIIAANLRVALAARLWPCEILVRLGAGTGEVYSARDARLERTVAIKMLPSHLSSDRVRKQRFERAAETISSSARAGEAAQKGERR
jgi:eukaryotic-like serine/threonine-protein kinase